MRQLRVGHSGYRIEGQSLENPFFLGRNGVSLSIGRLSSKMVKCGNFFAEYSGPVVAPRFINGTTIREMEFSCLNRFLRSLRSVEMTV